MGTPAAWTLAPAIALGLAIGSFVGMLAYRLPREQVFSRLRSFCPSCKKTISWQSNIPLISYALQRGKCRYCAAGIHWRYPLAESVCAALAVACWASYGVSIPAAVVFALCVVVFAAALIDAEHQVLPNVLVLPLLWGGLLFSLTPYWPGVIPAPALEQPARAIIGAALGYSVLGAINVIWLAMRKRVGFGGGDLKLLAALGAWLGPEGVLFVLFPAAVLGTGIGLFPKSSRSNLLRSRIAFGPFLAAAGTGTIFLRPQLADYWLMNWSFFAS